jgi:EpsD family peptidyl-prolyl cis-trans isomerase
VQESVDRAPRFQTEGDMMVMLRMKMVAVFSAVVLAAGCGKSEDRKPASQVAAKVNGTEISVHQINNAMTRTGGGALADPKEAGRQARERLIDQQVLINQANEMKLDRDAAVMNAVDNARRQILTQAYIERATGDVAKPTADEVKKYYAEHPYIFGQRRIYRFHEIGVNATDEAQIAALKAQLQKKHDDMGVVASWLKSQNIGFNAMKTVKAAEQLPAGMAMQLQKSKAGDVLFFPAGNRAILMQVTSWQDVPLSESESTPYIEQMLWNQRRAEFAANELKKLRTQAKVEYVGDYAPQVAKAQSPSTPQDSAQQAAAQPAAAKSAQPAKEDTSFIDKALTGLK